MRTCDILVSGGGLSGLIAAIAFARAGFSTICVDPQPPITNNVDQGADLRTTAYLQPAQSFLADMGIWDGFAPYAMPLDVMRIVDAGGPKTPPTARIVKEFQSAELSELPFGWNIPNWIARRELMRVIDEIPNLQMHLGTSCQTLFTRETEARVRLSDGETVQCRLVIAADGRGSTLREQSGISVKTTRFGQKALAFAVTHPIPHENVSTEIHRSGGPFTLVPLPDHNGMPCSAVVWMEHGPNTTRLANIDVDQFELEMSERSCHLLGPLTLVSKRSVWPIIAQIADRLCAQRVALIAETAHVVPPIGAQGLNMSLTDIRTVYELACENPNSLGQQDMLDRYHNARYRDIQTRVLGITALNKTSMMGAQPLRDLRASGINALYALPQVRKTLMQMGLGAR